MQGNGDGIFNPSIILTNITDSHQVNTVFGFLLPVDSDEESTLHFLSLNYAHRLTDKLSPLVELNWYPVWNEGQGMADEPASSERRSSQSRLSKAAI